MSESALTDFKTNRTHLNNKYEIAYSTIKKLRLQAEWEDFFSRNV